MPNFPNIILYAIPFFGLAIALELYITTKQYIKTYETKGTFSSIAINLSNVILGFACKALVLLVFFLVYDNFRLFTIPVAW